MVPPAHTYAAAGGSKRSKGSKSLSAHMAAESDDDAGGTSGSEADSSEDEGGSGSGSEGAGQPGSSKKHGQQAVEAFDYGTAHKEAEERRRKQRRALQRAQAEADNVQVRPPARHLTLFAENARACVWACMMFHGSCGQA